MSLDRAAVPFLPPAGASEAFDQDRARVRALAQGVLEESVDACAGAADALGGALVALVPRWPAERIQPLLRELLEDDRLGARLDGRGNTLRTTFVRVQQALGFPFALEVDPEDLALLKPRPPLASRGEAMGAFTFAVAGVGMVWNTLASVGAINNRWLGSPASHVAVAFFALGAVHGVLAMGTVLQARRARTAQTRRNLTRLVLGAVLAPVGVWTVAALTEVSFARVHVVGLACAAPSMLTAILCGLTAVRLGPASEARARELP